MVPFCILFTLKDRTGRRQRLRYHHEGLAKSREYFQELFELSGWDNEEYAGTMESEASLKFNPAHRENNKLSVLNIPIYEN